MRTTCHIRMYLYLETYSVHIFQRETVYYRLQHRRVRVFAPNVISLKGPLYNLKQSHVLHSRYFFENYFSSGTALLCLPLLYFRLTWTNSNSAGKVPILVSFRVPILFPLFMRLLPVRVIFTFFSKETMFLCFFFFFLQFIVIYRLEYIASTSSSDNVEHVTYEDSLITRIPDGEALDVITCNIWWNCNGVRLKYYLEIRLSIGNNLRGYEQVIKAEACNLVSFLQSWSDM